VNNLAKTRESSEVVKGRILEAAGRLFAQHGVNGVSIRKIAAEAGINHALIFRYFGSKDGLVTAILRRDLSGLRNVFSVMPEPLSVAISNLRKLLLNFLNEDQDLVKLIVRSGLDGPSPEVYIDPGTERIATMLAKWIESQQVEEGLPDAKLVSIVVIGTLFSLVSASPWLITSVGFPPKDFDKCTEDIVDVLMWVIIKAMGLPAGVLKADQNAQTAKPAD